MSSSEFKSLQPGTILIAEPYLPDATFHRKVILLCEHSQSHSFGLVLNQKLETVIEYSVESNLFEDIQIFSGGPVDSTIIQFLHRRPDLIPGGVQITKDLYWAGDFESAIHALVEKTLTFDDIKFFMGYSGWDAGQLERELSTNSWHVSKAKSEYVFDVPYTNLWSKVLYDMGGDFRVLSTYPIDPSLN